MRLRRQFLVALASAGLLLVTGVSSALARPPTPSEAAARPPLPSLGVASRHVDEEPLVILWRQA